MAASVLAAVLVADARTERTAHDAVARAANGTAVLRDGVAAALVRVNDPLSPTPPRDLDELPPAAEVATAAAIARDTARPRLTEPFDRDGTTVVLALSPRYGTTVPTSTEERRQALRGFLVEELDLATMVDEAFTDVAVRVIDEGTVVAAIGDEGGVLDSLPLNIGGRSWRIEFGAGSGTGLAPALVVTAGFAAAVAAVIALRRLERGRLDAAAEAMASAGQSAMVVDVGSVLHRSLDLGEILPALGLQLVDGFDLVGLEILVCGDDGVLDPTFVIGAVDAAPHRHEVPLERLGRTVGELRLGVRQPLSDRQQATLRAIGELTASTIANVQAFENEQDAVRRLAELDELKTNFLATVSHELSTPVTAIKGFSSLLANSWDSFPDEERREHVARIARNASSLGELVRGLLEFARMERQSLHVERQDLDLSELVSSVVSQTASLLDDHDLIVDAPTPVPASVDAYAVERIVANLLTNAGKFSPPGTPIVVGVRPGNGTAVLSVADRGPGIAIEERPHIFSRFYRGTGQHAVKTRGAGVGLAVVRELVDRMGATVSISDTAGGGATFTVEFLAATSNGDRP